MLDLNNIPPCIWGPVIVFALIGVIAFALVVIMIAAIWSDAKDVELGGDPGDPTT